MSFSHGSSEVTIGQTLADGDYYMTDLIEFLNRYVELKQTEVDRYNKAIEKENIKRI